MVDRSRRSFLAAGVGLLVAAACGGDDDEATPPRATTPPPDQLDVLIASPQLVVGTDQRVALGVLRDAEPIGDRQVQIAFGRSPTLFGAPQPAQRHDQGIEERPYYSTSYRFPQTGKWWVQVTAGDEKGTTVLPVIAPDSTEVPLPGGRMVPVATPTTADARGVDPICTRQPACPFHEVGVDVALGEGRPLAVLFSTPALCQSAVCGPVLDVLMAEAPPFADRVRFVHVEVFKNLQAQFREDDLTEGMRAYHLTFEPVLYLAGADGGIRERLDGPVDRVEVAAALRRLTGS